ncbi:hypothetical protein HC776_01425 [bacterium]|nr:hypothetical protein [bacterium]
MTVIPSSLPLARRRLWQGIAAVLSVGTLVMLLVYLVLALQYRTLPFVGFTMTYTGTVNAGVPTTFTPWRGLDAGLVRTDVIDSINGQPMRDMPTDWRSTPYHVLDLLSTMRVNDVVTVNFERNTRLATPNPEHCTPPVGDLAQCSVTYRLARFINEDFLAYLMLPYLSGVILAVLGWVVMYLRGDRLEGVLCGALILGSAIFSAGLFDAGFTFRLVPIWLMVAALTSGVAISIGMLVPLPVRAIMRYPALLGLPLIVALVAGIVLVGYYFAQRTPGITTPRPLPQA